MFACECICVYRMLLGKNTNKKQTNIDHFPVFVFDVIPINETLLARRRREGGGEAIIYPSKRNILPVFVRNRHPKNRDRCARSSSEITACRKNTKEKKKPRPELCRLVYGLSPEWNPRAPAATRATQELLAADDRHAPPRNIRGIVGTIGKRENNLHACNFCGQKVSPNYRNTTGVSGYRHANTSKGNDSRPASHGTSKARVRYTKKHYVYNTYMNNKRRHIRRYYDDDNTHEMRRKVYQTHIAILCYAYVSTQYNKRYP